MKSSIDLYLISLLLIFSSCQVTSDRVLGNYVASADENEVVYSALIAAINPDSIFRAQKKENYRDYINNKLKDTTFINDSAQLYTELVAYETSIDDELIYLFLANKLSKTIEWQASTIEDAYFNSKTGLSIDSTYLLLLQNIVKMDHSARFKLKSLPTEYDYVLKKINVKHAEEFNKLNNGLVSFSRVAFNQEHTLACVTISRVFGPLNAHGAVYFLRKDQNGWYVEDYQILWYS